jgi:hypothetical protein
MAYSIQRNFDWKNPTKWLKGLFHFMNFFDECFGRLRSAARASFPNDVTHRRLFNRFLGENDTLRRNQERGATASFWFSPPFFIVALCCSRDLAFENDPTCRFESKSHGRPLESRRFSIYGKILLVRTKSALRYATRQSMLLNAKERMVAYQMTASYDT